MASGTVCTIPDRNATLFFSNGDNLTPNHTTYGDGDDDGTGNGVGDDGKGGKGGNGANMLAAQTWAFWLAMSLIYASFWN